MIMVLAIIVAGMAIMVVDPLTMVVVRPITAVAATTAIRASPFFCYQREQPVAPAAGC